MECNWFIIILYVQLYNDITQKIIYALSICSLIVNILKKWKI